MLWNNWVSICGENEPISLPCITHKNKFLITCRHFPGDTVFKNPPANAGGLGLIPGLGRAHTPVE